eukprot:CAMPEP_0197281558 /NCGR_PEP_ID=MMETSP1432-20130617/22930_1 /TAXON_ID=44447 /ORGANISM="Pseudo-nitzschia delicatissima, Strain UNC1205" /LENGTH=186 /DNA_ID=CAMNT_0042748375 /DNA_START=192 /DNA_END=752 /DNA_ORIENTATION=+
MECQQQPDSRRRQQECYRSITAFLDQNEIEYKTVHHEETLTSEDSARVRGVPLSTGGKALLLKIDETIQSYFCLFVMSASRKLNSKAIKKEFKKLDKPVKSTRFATADELAKITNGLVPGCVPPFGKPILKIAGDYDVYLELYVDTSIQENEVIAFNAGSLTDSVIMSANDYIRVSQPTGIFTFSK